MNRIPSQKTSVSTLLGASILRADGTEFGRVCEFAVSPLVDSCRVQGLVVRATGKGPRSRRLLVPVALLELASDGQLQMLPGAGVEHLPSHSDFLLLERDLLDQQIIDINGHKVVRVNDVDLEWVCSPQEGLSLRIAEVEVGTRGAVRRLLKGLPVTFVERVARHVAPTVIPWEFVDLIDRDPARRVRLKIEQEKLSNMHPSDLADILEELAPAEREALFSSLDEEVAAEALEEVERKTQKKLLESLDSERIAGILEEMDPGAAADLLAELSDERSGAILEEMGEQERHEVEELLEYEPDTAAGLMTTEYVAVGLEASVAEAVRALDEFEGDLESVTEIFLVDGHGHLKAILPLSCLMLEVPDRRLSEIGHAHLSSTKLETSARKVAEQFDKYNLRSLPVLDSHQQLAGVIRPEHVIAWLRAAR